jgi:hypothetical protein
MIEPQFDDDDGMDDACGVVAWRLGLVVAGAAGQQAMNATVFSSSSVVSCLACL